MLKNVFIGNTKVHRHVLLQTDSTRKVKTYQLNCKKTMKEYHPKRACQYIQDMSNNQLENYSGTLAG